MILVFICAQKSTSKLLFFEVPLPQFSTSKLLIFEVGYLLPLLYAKELKLSTPTLRDSRWFDLEWVGYLKS
jgi:hypothetical protein